MDIFSHFFLSRAVDHIDLDLDVAHRKKLRKPNCTKLANLPYSIHAYDHLQVRNGLIPNPRLTGDSVCFRAVSIVLNNESCPELDGTAGQLLVDILSDL